MHELPLRHRIGKMKLGIMVDPTGESSKHIVRIEPSATKDSSVVRRKVRTIEDGLLALCCEWVAKHQIGKPRCYCSPYEDSLDFPGIALNFLILLGLTHACFPGHREHTLKCFRLSYYNPDTGDYAQGWNDAYMVIYWVLLSTGLRAGVINFVLVPFVQRLGIESKKDITRFGEQAWAFIYYSTFWSLGMVEHLLRQSEEI